MCFQSQRFGIRSPRMSLALQHTRAYSPPYEHHYARCDCAVLPSVSCKMATAWTLTAVKIQILCCSIRMCGFVNLQNFVADGHTALFFFVCTLNSTVSFTIPVWSCTSRSLPLPPPARKYVSPFRRHVTLATSLWLLTIDIKECSCVMNRPR